MTTDIIVFYLEERDLKSAIEANKKFESPFRPHFLVRILNQYNEHTFDGYLCNGIPYDRAKCINKYTARNSSVIDDYNDKSLGAFTSDGISFFRINRTTITSEQDGIIIFTFKYLNTSSFKERNTAFMIMPFKYEQLNRFYEDNIKAFLKNSDLKIHVFRADDFPGNDIVPDTILEQINKAEFIICEITNCNKNVFFEIGYAKGMNKDIIYLLEKSRKPNFFDVNHFRRIEYNHQEPVNFQNELIATITNIRTKRLI